MLGTAQPSPGAGICMTATRIIPIRRGCYIFRAFYLLSSVFPPTISMGDGHYHFHLTDKEMKQGTEYHEWFLGIRQSCVHILAQLCDLELAADPLDPNLGNGSKSTRLIGLL